MRASLLALVLGGCGFSATPANAPGDLQPDASGGGAPNDAGVDGARLDGTVAPVCLGKFATLCVDPPDGTVTLMTQEINTATSNRCRPYSATPDIDACVITGQSIVIPSGNTVTVTGSQRLILFATGEITIAGTLDASSRRNGIGPAADTGPCRTDFEDGENGTTGGGGWGGSLGGTGNNGGNGGGGGGGDGGKAASQGSSNQLTGGCPGGNGGNNAAGAGGGGRGHGGGAVLLISGGRISITGAVNASGAGGGGSFLCGGGGGGGSGGMIVLDGNSVSVEGQCFANGGGGGEGASTVVGRSGGESISPVSVGRGGSDGSSGGGNGGNGGLGNNRNGAPGLNGSGSADGTGGGGGGGGGAGIIKVFSKGDPDTDDPNKVSPLPT